MLSLSEGLPPHAPLPPSQLFYFPAYSSPPKVYLQGRIYGNFESLIFRIFIAMEWILYKYLTNVNSTWQMVFESILSCPLLFCLGLGHPHSSSGLLTGPQMVLNDLPTASLFVRIHYSLLSNFYTNIKGTFLVYTSVTSFASSETSNNAFLILVFIVFYHFASNYFYKKNSPSNILFFRHTTLLTVSVNTIDNQICSILYLLKFFKN